MGPDLTGADNGAVPTRTSFYYSFSFLPAEKRNALRTVYEFCRRTDDLVDNFSSPGEKASGLKRWREELDLAEGGKSGIAVLNEVGRIASDFGIPFRILHDLLDGVEMDIARNRYATFDELERYCELVASSVGLMCINIFGLRNPRTEEYARLLGVALQLTNIIRDVGVDAGFGRIYIPLDEIEKFGCTEGEILKRSYSGRFRDLMAHQASRAEGYYADASSALRKSDRPAMYPAMIMEKIYAATLATIRRAGYRVLAEPVRLPGWRQFLIAVPYILASRIRPG